MINVKPAKSAQGKIELPVSPDLLFMTALGACAQGAAVRVPNVLTNDVTNDIIRSLKNHVDVKLDGETFCISPLTQNDDNDGGENSSAPAQLITLPDSLIQYRAIYIFIALGMGKTVYTKNFTQPQRENIIALAKKIGVSVSEVTINSGDNDNNNNITALAASGFDAAIATESYINDYDSSALLAYLFGRRDKLTFIICDHHLSTPLRPLANTFGLTLSVKQNADNADPLAKRMKFLQSKQRGEQTQSQITYTVEADFTKRVNENANANENAIEMKIPGDEILSAIFIALKCLVQKGEFEICNAPLETWAAQTLQFVKKSGGKISVQENAKTAFGSCGTIKISKSEFVGRKTKCSPFYQYVGQLPAMTIISAFAAGKSVFRELAMLREFDPDGLDQLEKCLRPLGIRHGEMPDGIVIEGAKEFDGFDMIEPQPAHIAAAFCIAGLKCVGKTSVADDFIFARWPNFEKWLNEICEFRGK